MNQRSENTTVTTRFQHSLLPAMLVVGLPFSGWGAEPPAPTPTPTLRGVFSDDFLVGVALNGRVVGGRSAEAAELAARQFSSLTAENDMKWMSLHPWPGRYRFEAADAYVEFAERHGMKVIGHTLVWHSQTPRWVFEGRDGKSPDGRSCCTG